METVIQVLDLGLFAMMGMVGAVLIGVILLAVLIEMSK